MYIASIVLGGLLVVLGVVLEVRALLSPDAEQLVRRLALFGLAFLTAVVCLTFGSAGLSGAI